jgi:hypothetical protein
MWNIFKHRSAVCVTWKLHVSTHTMRELCNTANHNPSATIHIQHAILYRNMLCYAILYYTILYYTILYYTILYYTILYCTLLYCTILYCIILCYTIPYYTVFSVAQQPLVGNGLHIFGASGSHSVGLLWTSDEPDAVTSVWQHTTLTKDRHPWPPAGFEHAIPASERPQIHALGRATTGIGIVHYTTLHYTKLHLLYCTVI